MKWPRWCVYHPKGQLHHTLVITELVEVGVLRRVGMALALKFLNLI